MRTLLAISPHLDDAAFSAGATLWSAAQEGWRVVIATIFAGNVERPTGFALACQLDKGLEPEVDYMALRRDEDRAACSALGAEPLHLPLLEAPHRGYDNAAALFGEVRPDDPARLQVSEALATLFDDLRPACVLGPLGIGGHVDHLIVREALEATADEHRTQLWEDWPYLDREPAFDRERATRIALTAHRRTAKQQACAAYRSQLRFQFGGLDKLHVALAAQQAEHLHAIDDAPALK